MKLDATNLRYLSPEDFRVLKAAETGSLNHEAVPSTLIASISGLQHAGLNKIMSELAKRGLIAREKNIKYDGWRLTYGGYDWLAVKALREKDVLVGVGTRVGVGKESDIYMAQMKPLETDQDLSLPAVLKIHRLGRISFRKIKEKRDYLGKRKSAPNWMYLSRLAAKKEWQFLQTLHEHGFPVPLPVAHSRHAILMSRIDGFPLRQIVDLPMEYVASLFASLMALIVRLARAGLIHCDFNEFNIMIREVKLEFDGDEYETSKEDLGIWRREVELARQGVKEEDVDEVNEYDLQPNERIEKGNGFERIYKVNDENRVDLEVEEESEGYSEDDDTSEGEFHDSDEEEEDFDVDGTNEGLKIELGDGSAIEPILIDFPQMISVEHINAEYYFDRDVQCICTFFNKRFRYQNESIPRFRDVVPENRQQVRESRAKRRSRKAREDEIGSYVPDAEDEKLGLELDVLTDASGVGSIKKPVTALEQYMSTLRMQQDAKREKEKKNEKEDDGRAVKEGSDDIEKEEENTDDEEAEEEDEEEQMSDRELDDRLQDGTLLPPSLIDPIGRGFGRQSRRTKEGGPKIKKEANALVIKDKVAADRQKKVCKDARHHGKKAHAGKTGRAWMPGAGGKAKTSDQAMVYNSLHF